MGHRLAEVHGVKVSWPTTAAARSRRRLLDHRRRGQLRDDRQAPEGFTKLDVTAKAGAVRRNRPVFVAVDSDRDHRQPVLHRQGAVAAGPIYGSQRTELSLAILGLDADGTSPVALGEQVLIHTATAGEDSRLKFLGCRAASRLGGTTDSTATTGFVQHAVAPQRARRVHVPRGQRCSRASTSPTRASRGPRRRRGRCPTRQPRRRRLARRLRPGDRLVHVAGRADDCLADRAAGLRSCCRRRTSRTRAATLTVKVAADVASVVRVDEIWLAHIESGQVTLLNTNDSGISAVRSTRPRWRLRSRPHGSASPLLVGPGR
jgi:hypothetical protein